MGQNSFQFLKFSALAVVVVAFGAAIGYYVIGGARESHPVSAIPTTASPAVDTTVSQPTTQSVAALQPHRTNGDYTAPGAPKIRIMEEKTPSLTDTSHENTDNNSGPDSTSHADTEASQVAAPPVKTDTPDDSSSNTTPDTSASPPADSTPNTDSNTNTGGDFERTTVHTDPEAGQEGSTPQGKPLFRVQTGSFETSKNAKILAEALRNRGYTASTRTEQDGDKTVYKVQTGAYRSKAAAAKAALKLQGEGYPAYVSPIAP